MLRETFFIFLKLLQMKQLPCINQYVLYLPLIYIIRITNNLTDTIFS